MDDEAVGEVGAARRDDEVEDGEVSVVCGDDIDGDLADLAFVVYADDVPGNQVPLR